MLVLVLEAMLTVVGVCVDVVAVAVLMLMSGSGLVRG